MMPVPELQVSIAQTDGQTDKKRPQSIMGCPMGEAHEISQTYCIPVLN